MRIQVPLGTYIAGDTLIHRMPAGPKLLGIIIFIVLATFFGSQPLGAAICGTLVLISYLIARIPWRISLGQLLTPLPILLFLAAFQVWNQGWRYAFCMLVMLLSCIMAASLLSLTTALSQLMEATEQGLKPLERFGFPAATVALILALTVRLIPLQVAAVEEVLAARKARGLGFSALAFFVPVMIKSLRRAQTISEALWARGIGDT
ncbi:energy-coupling factor transporter transmembrane component T family protein [Corynebacterium caspium]|uniref:energy-coupling factor transporter transmembrane component T family protein n=1 Tax=Corynebacterium caspium TaxID=234828 RepID=UPI0003643843|nr:energy-coupling factor transporter transmembrane protein EcfT [Corynebacterium caspium]WKD59109.1 Energy-coupling factor transporter transmembrane protein EcfT [Corynebacterium caspium DSM 44850]